MTTHLVANERAKLRATYLNNLAVAATGAGVIAPIIAALFGTSTLAGWKTVVGAVLWTSASYLLHTAARSELGMLREPER